MDFELEVGTFIGNKGNQLGRPIKVGEAEDYIFGLCLMNDWSVRDVQVWEYVPLGPFTGKNIGTVISPWIVTMEALAPFRCQLPEPKKPFLEYLQDPNYASYDIDLRVNIQPAGQDAETEVSTSNFKYLYWSMAQQITQHTVTGCNLKTGDLFGSGTISGTEPGEFGSMIELSTNGKKPITVNGAERGFLEDNDTVVFYGTAQKDGVRVGFGECRSAVLPVVDQ